MDQGIIANVKLFYRKFLIRDRVDRIERKQKMSVDLLHALRYLQQAWDSVKPATIRNCFKEASFVVNNNVSLKRMDNLL
jgi:hypothetical protein